MLQPGEILIGEHNYRNFLVPQVVDGEEKGRGCVPRDYTQMPRFSSRYEQTFDMPVVPRSEWADRVSQLVATQSQLSDLRNVGNNGASVPSRDQDGKGYCWAHSSVSASLLLRARDNDPYADLSAYAIACIIKSYADEGGWGAQSLDWIIQNGVPTSRTWPQQSMSRSNDNAAMRQEAGLHKVSQTWMDASAQEYDRTLTFDQVATCLLLRVPVVVDFNWWSHSVCAADLVNGSSVFGVYRGPAGKILKGAAFDKHWGMNNEDTGGFSIRIWNSWGDGWSAKGMGVISGSKAVPDGACAPRVSYASAA